MKIDLLMEFNNELGLEYIKLHFINKMPIRSILIIGDSYNSHRQQLVEDRTNGQYKSKGLLDALNGNIVPVYFFDDVNSQELDRHVQGDVPDLIVSASSKIIKIKIFDYPKIGMLNCHTGILPNYRGCSCVEWAIYEDTPVGATVHFVDKGIDTGPMILSGEMPIYMGDKYADVRYKMIYFQAEVMYRGVQAVLDGFRKEGAKILQKGRYYKPLKDKELIAKVESKLENMDYKHLIEK
jgi:methionyl-tRNA formyltransferase